jgi:hypothetical protein
MSKKRHQKRVKKQDYRWKESGDIYTWKSSEIKEEGSISVLFLSLKLDDSGGKKKIAPFEKGVG